MRNQMGILGSDDILELPFGADRVWRVVPIWSDSLVQRTLQTRIAANLYNEIMLGPHRT